MRAAIVMLLAAALLAGCGGESEPRDPVETFKAIAESAGDGAVDEIESLLTAASQARAGEVVRRLEPFVDGYRFVVTEPADEWAVIAIRNEATTRAAAFVLKQEAGEWRLELRDVVRISPTGPRPGSSQKLVVQLAAELTARERLGPTGLWLDSSALDIRAGASADGRRATVFANLTQATPPGRHVVTAFATAGTSAAAVAWTFRVSAPR